MEGPTFRRRARLRRTAVALAEAVRSARQGRFEDRPACPLPPFNVHLDDTREMQVAAGGSLIPQRDVWFNLRRPTGR